MGQTKQSKKQKRNNKTKKWQASWPVSLLTQQSYNRGEYHLKQNKQANKQKKYEKYLEWREKMIVLETISK